MNVLLVAEESAGIQALRWLDKSNHRLVAVMCSPGVNGVPTVHSVAEQLGYTTWPAASVKEPGLAEKIRAENIDILVNIHSLYLIHKDVLNAPHLGSFNMHPGPLPRYAGLNAPSWALFHGETTHGVTIHRMVPGVDAGPIAFQSVFDIVENDTALSVSTKCIRLGIESIKNLLDLAASDPEKIPAIPQNVSERTYFGKAAPNDGRIVWASSASQVMNFVRAFDYFPFKSPWGSAKTSLGSVEMGITKVFRSGKSCNLPVGTIGVSDTTGAYVATKDEWVRIPRVNINGEYVDAGAILKTGDRLS